MLLQPTEEEEANHELKKIGSQSDSKDSIAEHFTTILCAPCKPPTSDPPGLSLEYENIAEHEAQHQPKSEMECQSNRHTFVVLADSQLGMTSLKM